MGVAVLGESRVSSPIQVSEEEIYQIGMPMRSHNLILLFGLLVTITLTRASPLDAEEELDSDAIEDRYNDEDDDNYPDPIDKRAISGFEHAFRIRRSEADQELSLRHAMRLRASPFGHALRIKKANSNFNHALRIRSSPYGHALRIKKGGQYSHALRIRSSPYSHALRVRRSGMPEFEDDYFNDYPDTYKRASAYSHVLRVR